jgi:uncharacterized integral membrane protein
MTEDRDQRSSIAAVVRLLPPIAIALLLGAFAASNSQSTEIDFVFTEAEAPLILVLLATAVVGGVVVALLRFRSNHSG